MKLLNILSGLPLKYIVPLDLDCSNHLMNLCLEKEFKLREIPYQRQLKIPLSYKGLELDYTYRVDFLVANTVVVEVKAVDILMPVHHAQLLSYLKLGNWKMGLLINFHVPVLSMGIKRIVLGFDR